MDIWTTAGAAACLALIIWWLLEFRGRITRSHVAIWAAASGGLAAFQCLLIPTLFGVWFTGSIISDLAVSALLPLLYLRLVIQGKRRAARAFWFVVAAGAVLYMMVLLLACCVRLTP